MTQSAELKKKEQYTNRCLQQKKTKTPHYNPYESHFDYLLALP
jgi:hypothetical protein